MRGMALKLMILCALLVATAFAVQFAVADSGGDGAEIEIKAPLEAVNCLGVPPTITLLGVIIDVSQVKGDEDETFNCASLVVGQVVEVGLASDVPNATTGLLTAVEAEQEGEEECGEDDCVKIEAPIQSVDPVGHTITILGLTIDISQAKIDGDDEGEQEDRDEGEDDQPSAPLTLIAGQFVEVKLASNVPPLVATEIEVKNSGTGIEVEIVDQNGNEIDDDEDDVQVVATVSPAKTAGVKSKGGKKALTFSAHGNGRVRLSGLPAGKAKLVITRIHTTGKSTGKASALIQSQQTTHVMSRLKQGK